VTDVPLWVAILVSILSLAGAAATLIGCLGLVRFSSFYERVHAPTLGTSFGTVAILVASALYFYITGDRPAVHEVLILIFVTLTTPVTLMLLARAALYRDRAERNGGVPPSIGQDVVVQSDNQSGPT
jgi:multicomponent K+:H+ antiporter subunit G